MKKVGAVIFSPTGTTAEVCRTIAEAVPDAQADLLNITLPAEREKLMSDPSVMADPYDRLIFGVPVYLGKVPKFAEEIITEIKGKGKPATAVAVYGNRDYGVSVKSLADLLTRNGFVVDSAGAFIGQHTYSDIVPMATGRPDSGDAKIAGNLGRRLSGTLRPLKDGEIPVELDDFSTSDDQSGIVPFHDESECKECGVCAEHCPRGIIEAGTGKYISQEAMKTCLGCFGCVQACPNNGRQLKVPDQMRSQLEMMFSEVAKNRREPIYIVGEKEAV